MIKKLIGNIINRQLTLLLFPSGGVTPPSGDQFLFQDGTDYLFQDGTNFEFN